MLPDTHFPHWEQLKNTCWWRTLFTSQSEWTYMDVNQMSSFLNVNMSTRVSAQRILRCVCCYYAHSSGRKNIKCTPGVVWGHQRWHDKNNQMAFLMKLVILIKWIFLAATKPSHSLVLVPQNIFPFFSAHLLPADKKKGQTINKNCWSVDRCGYTSPTGQIWVHRQANVQTCCCPR